MRSAKGMVKGASEAPAEAEGTKKDALHELLLDIISYEVGLGGVTSVFCVHGHGGCRGRVIRGEAKLQAVEGLGVRQLVGDQLRKVGQGGCRLVKAAPTGHRHGPLAGYQRGPVLLGMHGVVLHQQWEIGGDVTAINRQWRPPLVSSRREASEEEASRGGCVNKVNSQWLLELASAVGVSGG